MQLDLTKPGKYTGTLTIARNDAPKEGDRFGNVFFKDLFIKDPGPDLQRVTYFADSAFAKYLKEGEERECVIEWKPGSGGSMFVKLSRCFKKGMGGKGGGYASREPSFAEIHGLPIATILAHAPSVEEGENRVIAYIEIILGRGSVQASAPSEPRRSAEARPVVGSPRAHGEESAHSKTNGSVTLDDVKRAKDVVGLDQGQYDELTRLCIEKGLPTNTTLVEAVGKGYRTVPTLMAYVQQLEPTKTA